MRGAFKRRRKVIIYVVIVVVVFVGIWTAYRGDVIVKNPAVQEYVAGQGNIKGDVDVEYFQEKGEAFQIGASASGYAVFKDPREARRAVISKHRKGMIELWRCGALFGTDFLHYVSGMAIEAELSEDGVFVEAFCDIYENSFYD